MIFCLLGFLLGCNDAEKEQQKRSSKTAISSATSPSKGASSTSTPPKKVVDVVESAPLKKIDAPSPVQEPLNGGPYPGLLVSQAWFWKDGEGGINPGPARLDIWRQTDRGWKRTRLEDPDSNVFHKAMSYNGGILTIGAFVC